jgi:RimJ/RimL family protein N-acetyltransferase
MHDPSRCVGDIPIIATARLTLRAHRLDDFDACAAMWADPAVTRHIGGKPSSQEDVWARMLRYAGHWALLGFGYWAIEETATGEFVGELGFADFRREIEPPLEGMPEIGWALVSPAHGKGYATEAVSAVSAWGDERFGERTTACLISPDNLASIRVAEKCGYTQAGRAAYKGQATLVFTRAGSTAR